MKTMTRSVLVSLTMAGVAFAQPATPPKTGTTAPGAGAPAAKPAPKPMAPAAPTAKAGAPVMKKAPEPAPTAPAAPPKPAPELVAFTKAQSGTWRCKGQGMDMSMQMVPMTATVRAKADLDGFWLQESFDGKMGKAKFKFVAYTTYDPSSKKWRRVMVDNMGMQMIGTSDGPKDNKTTYNLDTMGGGPGGQFRDHMETVDKRNVKAWGEMSMDKGKTWTKAYEMTCKK